MKALFFQKSAQKMELFHSSLLLLVSQRFHALFRKDRSLYGRKVYRLSGFKKSAQKMELFHSSLLLLVSQRFHTLFFQYLFAAANGPANCSSRKSAQKMEPNTTCLLNSIDPSRRTVMLRSFATASTARLKAQVWSTDFSVSAVIFITMVALIFFVFNITSQDAASQAALSDMQNRGLEASEALVRTPGYPPGWNSWNVQVVGLATQENSLNNSKIFSFLGMDYSNSKTALGLESYEYNFSLENLDGTAFYLVGNLDEPPGGFGSVGETEPPEPVPFRIEKGLPLDSAKDILPIERYVLIDGQIKRMKLIVWR